MGEEKKTVIFVTHNVEEAVFLGDEVICLTSIPAETGKVLKVGYTSTT